MHDSFMAYRIQLVPISPLVFFLFGVKIILYTVWLLFCILILSDVARFNLESECEGDNDKVIKWGRRLKSVLFSKEFHRQQRLFFDGTNSSIIN